MGQVCRGQVTVLGTKVWAHLLPTGLWAWGVLAVASQAGPCGAFLLSSWLSGSGQPHGTGAATSEATTVLAWELTMKAQTLSHFHREVYREC